MSAERRRRAQKVVDARQRVVDVAQAELGRAQERTRGANAAAAEARRDFQGRVGHPVPDECSSHDLALEHAYRGTLEKRADFFARAAREALAAEESARAKVTLAKTGHKKVETWRDRIVGAIQAEEARAERLATDELAARIGRTA